MTAAKVRHPPILYPSDFEGQTFIIGRVSLRQTRRSALNYGQLKLAPFAVFTAPAQRLVRLLCTPFALIE